MKSFLVVLALVAACSAQLEFELGRSTLFNRPILTYSYIPQVLRKETDFIKEVKIDSPKKIDTIKDEFLAKPVEDTPEVKIAKAEFMMKFKEEELKHLLAKKGMTLETLPLAFYKPWEVSPLVKTVELAGKPIVSAKFQQQCIPHLTCRTEVEKEPIIIEKPVDFWDSTRVIMY